MNARRKLESHLVEESARRLLESDPSLLEYAVIVLSHPDWAAGVVGSVADRLAEEFRKPVVLLCEEDDWAFGSGRSVPGVNITDALKTCREKLLKFGGHARAAGMTLRRDDILDFRRLLSRTVRDIAAEQAEELALPIDAYVRLSEISFELEGDLRRLAPFGNGNPPLTLASTGLHIARKKKLGRQGDHLELVVADDEGTQQRVLWWNAGDKLLPAGKFDLAYQLRVSRFTEPPELVLEPVDLQARESETIEISQADENEIEDFSHVADPRAKLAEVLASDPAATVWREADASIVGSNRLELTEAETLIVWTTPPGPDEWQTALDKIHPRRIIVFNQRPAELTMEGFLQRLGGLLKFVVNSKGGETSLRELAAAMAQRTDAVRYGLNWYQYSGQLGVELRAKGRVSIVRDRAAGKSSEQASFEKLLKTVLAETAAYRNHWAP
jgi:single-stranded-DNA-specific exonuclease